MVLGEDISLDPNETLLAVFAYALSFKSLADINTKVCMLYIFG